MTLRQGSATDSKSTSPDHVIEWGLVIVCDGEEHQVELLNRFRAENLKTHAFVTE